VPKNDPADSGKTDAISIIIPTFQRSEGLLKALKSLSTQLVAANLIHVIIIDNNPTAQEQPLVESLSDLFKNPVTYIHVAEAGLSNARNAAMAVVKTRFVAFLDDDMIASPEWALELLAASHKYEAGIVFGPTFAVMPNPDDVRNPYLQPLFSRLIDKDDDGLVETTLGAGGCLLDLDHCNMPSPPFDINLNKRGGEDDILFDKLRLQGTRVAWTPTATCLEVVPERRTQAAYIRSRNFGFGQGPARIHASRGLTGVPGILYFMATGSLQTFAYGLRYALATIRKQPSSVKYLALASRGLGKIFWGERFSLELYGKINAESVSPLQQQLSEARPVESRVSEL
jgi:succinoglycan biosynthesis protein ExoM